MMQAIAIWLGFLVFIAPHDPAPSVLNSKDESASLECERKDVFEASRDHPGEVRAPGPRGDLYLRTALVCTERYMRLGLRSARDEAILTTLDARAGELASAADDLRPDLRDSTWLVETHYPSAQVSAKIAFAAKNALSGRGLRVSDRRPLLAAGDVEVLTRLHPDQAYAAACQRYHDNGSLRPGDALLGVIQRDKRATILHAGVCVDGVWQWLR